MQADEHGTRSGSLCLCACLWIPTMVRLTKIATAEQISEDRIVAQDLTCRKVSRISDDAERACI